MAHIVIKPSHPQSRPDVVKTWSRILGNTRRSDYWSACVRLHLILSSLAMQNLVIINFWKTYFFRAKAWIIFGALDGMSCIALSQSEIRNWDELQTLMFLNLRFGQSKHRDFLVGFGMTWFHLDTAIWNRTFWSNRWVKSAVRSWVKNCISLGECVPWIRWGNILKMWFTRCWTRIYIVPDPDLHIKVIEAIRQWLSNVLGPFLPWQYLRLEFLPASRTSD